MAGLYFQDATEMQKAQKDLLWSTPTDTNTLLTASGVATLNQKLNTTSKRPIGAINELKKEVASVNSTVESSMAQISTAVGDLFAGDSEDAQKLQAMGKNVIDAMYLMKQQLNDMETEVNRIDGGTF